MNNTSDDDYELFVVDGELTAEVLPEGDALGCFACVTSASTGSCPASSASSLTSASTISA